MATTRKHMTPNISVRTGGHEDLRPQVPRCPSAASQGSTCLELCLPFETARKCTRGGARTRNLLLRREAPYPLGHTSSECKLAPSGLLEDPARRRSSCHLQLLLCALASLAARHRCKVALFPEQTLSILEAGLEPAISSLGGRRLIH